MRKARANGWKSSRLGAALVALVVLSGCITGTGRTPQAAENPLAGYRAPGLSAGDVLEIAFFRTGRSAQSAYTIQPGDRLRVDVYGHPDLSQQQVLVLPDGLVSLNGVPSISARGLTPAELADRLGVIYRQRQIRDPIVSVSPSDADIRVASLTQLTNNIQGRFFVEVDHGSTLDLPFIDPIELPNDLAALQRDVQEAYDEAFEGQVDVTVNLRERLDPRVFVLGQVGKAGAVPFRGPMTSFMAIAGAGGFANTANASEVRLLRVGADGRYTATRLRLRAGMEGPLGIDNDVALQEGDIIYVPMTGVAVTNLRIEQMIRNMLPTAVGFGLAYDVR